jgi:hypothetical protein
MVNKWMNERMNEWMNEWTEWSHTIYNSCEQWTLLLPETNWGRLTSEADWRRLRRGLALCIVFPPTTPDRQQWKHWPSYCWLPWNQQYRGGERVHGDLNYGCLVTTAFNQTRHNTNLNMCNIHGRQQREYGKSEVIPSYKNGITVNI